MKSHLIEQDKTYDDFKKRTKFTILLLSILVIFFAFTTFKFYYDSQHTKIVGVSNQGVYQILRLGKDYGKNDAMKRLHARMFFELMFSGNKSNYKERISFALKLINKENGMYIYNDMKQENVFDTYERYPNMRTEIKIDSIVINDKVQPEEISVYAIQYAYYPNDNVITMDEIQPLLIAARFNLLDLGLDYYSEENPLGFMIENFDFFAYDLNN